MSGRSFRSVFMVASCAGAALGCYLVSLRVASERAALEDVETKIVLAQRDIRLLQTEIGTRGRLAQLERWNVKVIALSAPKADQFLKDGFELARLTTPEREAPLEAPVILASAPAAQAPAEKPTGDADPRSSQRPSEMMHLASLKTTSERKSEVSLEPRRAEPAPKVAKASAAKPASGDKGKSAPQAAAPKAPASKVAAAKETKPKTESAKAAPTKASASTTAKKSSAAKAAPARDPLAPLPETRTKLAAAKTQTSKDSTKKQ